MITRNAELKKLLKKQLKAEIATRNLYGDYIKKLKNKELIKDLKFIKNQEEEHIVLVKKIMTLVE